MVRIENLSIAYGKYRILDNVTIEIPRGALTLIQGASGVGKSTLLHTIGFMQQPSLGWTYYYCGRDIAQLSKKAQADFRLQKIGFVFQRNNLLPELSVQENVMLPLSVCADAVSKEAYVSNLLDYVGLAHLRNHYPYQLSGGEQQRVAIARALANEAEIILADEPTASLDKENAQLVLKLLQRLAHELGKHVVIVSHDAAVANIADVLYCIEDKAIRLERSSVSDKPWTEETGEALVEEHPQRKIVQFSRFYVKKRVADVRFNKIFVQVSAFVVAVAMLFLNFGGGLMEQQNGLINSISERSMFVVNDTLKSNVGDQAIITAYPEALGMSPDLLAEVGAIKDISVVYPYYEFLSFGASDNDADQAHITVTEGTNVVVDKRYDDRWGMGSGYDAFSIAPVYPEENLSHLLLKKSELLNPHDGVIVTNKLARQLGVPAEELVDKTIKIQVFVPIKAYHSADDVSGGKSVESNNIMYKLTTINSKIFGVLSEEYTLQRSLVRDTLFLPYNQFSAILAEHKPERYGKTKGGAIETELRPNALVLFAESAAKVDTVKAQLTALSPDFVIAHKAGDVAVIQANLMFSRRVMMLITSVMIGVMIVLFAVLYYIKNRSRRKEIGILKAIGLTERNIICLITFEMGQLALKSFVGASLIAFVCSIIGNSLFHVEIFSLTWYSFVLACIVSTSIMVLAGSIPTYQASKADPIDAIREGVK